MNASAPRPDLMRFFLKTYGCQMNERDSEAVEAVLLECGHRRADCENDADLVLVNTCSVRGKAEDKALGKLGLLVATKREKPERIIGALGCMVQRLGSSLLDRVPGLDLAVGTHRLVRLPEIVEQAARGDGPVVVVDEAERPAEVLSGRARRGPSAFVTILLGCERRCTYCIVPAVRGREWSRPGADVIEEVSRLAAGGVREVTLLGQSVMAYGRRNEVWPGNYTSGRGYREPLTRLLEAVGAVDGIERVRFTSGHPSGCTPELARAMAEIPEVCQHLHLPLQSGSDRILEKMKRGYSVRDYRLAVERLREAVPDMALTTDIIVGFPTETGAEFEMTRRFCAEIGFDNAFIFKYSPRPDTPAAGWTDDVPAQEKIRRNQVLLEDQNARCAAVYRSMPGTVVKVLVSGLSARNRARWTGRTRTNRIVVFEPAVGVKAGDTVRVRIEKAMPQSAFGVIERAAK